MLFCILGLDWAVAKVAKVSLVELVKESDVVVYGRTVTQGVNKSQTDSSIAWIQPFAIPVNRIDLSKVAAAPICNYTDTESVDLRAHPGTYVIFAKKGDHCYSPIAGIKSVVLVQGQAALTGAIDGQPEKMKVAKFLSLIRALALQQGS